MEIEAGTYTHGLGVHVHGSKYEKESGDYKGEKNAKGLGLGATGSQKSENSKLRPGLSDLTRF